MMRTAPVFCSLLWLSLFPPYAGAQDAGPPQAQVQESDWPAPPVAPEVIARDPATGRATIRAVRVDGPMRMDGRLDEAIYASAASLSDFVQIEPQEGQPATQKTEVWLLFDRDHIYVSARCWEAHPERMIEKEMRHDNTSVTQNEYFAFSFDTFHDRRNGVAFTIASTGGRLEGQVTAEKQYNVDWNPIWEASVGRFDGGWVVEAAIPFKSLRYAPGVTQVWGFQALRNNRWKNESAFLTPVPAVKGTGLGLMMFSIASNVVGLDAPPGSRNLEIKPYVVGELKSDNLTGVSNDPNAEFGLDVKYGLTQNLTADFTYNTDFAQVEADEQQVNLTRFNLFFPEKREFFLENQGTFMFGGVPPTTAAGDTPIFFYSRRIGLNRGLPVPIEAGGRLTGRVGAFSLGLLSIRSGTDVASGAVATQFSTARVKRDILRRSSIGMMWTGRTPGETGRSTNQAVGVDGTFAFFDNLSANTYWARTLDQGTFVQASSYRAQLDYAADRYGLQVEHLAVGEAFNPEIGFVRRRDIRRSFAQGRFSPRPTNSRVVRKLSWVGSGTYIENRAGRVEWRNFDGEFAVELQSSDRLAIGYGSTYEFLPLPFPIAPEVIVPRGGYEYGAGRVSYTLGQQWPLSGTASAEHGTFYDGTRTVLGLRAGRVNFTPRVLAEPTISINRVELPQGDFTTRLLGSRITFTATPLMFVSALLQYNSSTNVVATNVRWRWEYQPGSELFVVFNDQQDTLDARSPDVGNRALIVKINRVFRP